MGNPSESAHFAFQELVTLAHTDERLHAGERDSLARFARHLGISTTKAARYKKRCHKLSDFPTDPQRQLDLLVMLARVAYSDGVLQDAERRYFERLADEFDIPRTRLAHVLEAAEAKAERQVHLDRRWCGAALALVLVAGLLAWIFRFHAPDDMAGFKALDAELRKTLLLVHTRYTLVSDSAVARRLNATGTAFLTSQDGLAITNKHVVRPWLYSVQAQELLAEGYRLDPDSVECFAWPEGQQVLDAERRPLFERAFSTRKGNLEIIATAPDAEAAMADRPEHLRKPGVFCHAHDNGDLAVLRCAVRGAVVVAPLAETNAPVERLDPVLVLGYPRGLHLLETNFAVSTPAVGRVRKVEATLYVTAPIVGGNSGGPLFDRRGRVIGIATRTFGSATLAGCLRVDHARALLDSQR